MDEATRRKPKQCAATRKDGTPCTAPAMGEAVYCFAHDPARAEERREARQRGGVNRARSARIERLVPNTLRPVVALLLDALDEVHRGTLTPPQAAAMASLAGAVVKVYSVGVIEERIATLEALNAPADDGRRTA